MTNCNCNNFSAPICSRRDAVERCRHSTTIAATLDRRWVDSAKWMAVAVCKDCGQLWAEEASPFGTNHGGGPDCYYQIETNDPAAWLLEACRVISVLN